ncbi:MAG: trimethylamine methyltransferase family protein [Candidatus Latescibacterota bacterium]
MRLQGVSVLGTQECEDVHQATLRVLAETGVKVLDEHGRDLLARAGATGAGDVVRIPPRLAQEALAQAPRSVTVYDREGTPSLDLSGRNTYFGAGGPAPQYCDEQSGALRPFVLADCARLSRVCDACPQLAFSMAMAHCADAPLPVRDLWEVAVMLCHSPKPIVFTAHSPDNVSALAEVFQAAAGQGDRVLPPGGIFYSEPISPLTHAADSLAKVWRAADAGFPVLYTPAPMAGATGPATLAGNLVVGNAEWLSGLVMIQLHRPGTPVLYGGVFTGMDYGTCIFSYGSAELHLQTLAAADLGRWYGIPSFGTAGCTDASCSDVQSGFEASTSILLNLVGGANLVHDVGWLASAHATSAEQLVLNDAIIAHARRVLAGITVNPDTLAVPVIAEVGPQGSFLAHDHTLSHFASESLCTRFWDRRPLGRRLGGGPFMERVVERTEELARRHRPHQMAPEQERAVDAVLRRRAAALGAGEVPDWRE